MAYGSRVPERVVQPGSDHDAPEGLGARTAGKEPGPILHLHLEPP